MKNKNIRWFFGGIFIFSAGLGSIIGASNSPVVGVAISGLFGLMLAIYGIIPQKEKEQDALRPKFQGLAFIGKSLLLFTIGMLGGVYLGCEYRLATPKPVEKRFVWQGTRPPTSTYEALDWTMVTEILLSKGYSEKQIRELYQIRLQEIIDTSTADPYGRGKYSEQTPYFKMLYQQTPQEKKGRGPASVDPE